jgi:plasmid replication initiation protein
MRDGHQILRVSVISSYYKTPPSRASHGLQRIDCYKFPAYCYKFPVFTIATNELLMLQYTLINTIGRQIFMKPIPYQNNNIAVVSNHLLKSRYTLTVAEHRLLKSIVKRIPNYFDLKLEQVHSITVQEYAEDWGLPKEDARKEVQKAGKSLCDKTIYLPVDNPESFDITRWFAEGKYDRKTDVLKVMLTSTVVANISELTERFTKLDLLEMKDFSSSYSFRLYEILMCSVGENSYRNPNFLVEDLMNLLDVPDSLKDYRNFKARVLNPCTKELQTKTGKFSKLEISEIKLPKSKKVIGLKFNGCGIGNRYKKDSKPKELSWEDLG